MHVQRAPRVASGDCTNSVGTSAASDIPVLNILPPQPVKWNVVGPKATMARLNSHSHLSALSDMSHGSGTEWVPFTAVAFALIGTQNPREVFATGVTVLPSALLGSIVQLLFVKNIKRVMAKVLPASPADTTAESPRTPQFQVWIAHSRYSDDGPAQFASAVLLGCGGGGGSDPL